MYIDRILAPIKTLGPGRRLVIWTKGCSKKCHKCSNPELWTIEKAKNYDVKYIYNIVKNIYLQHRLDGITISGGDPLEQKKDMLNLVEKLNSLTKDILVYTGYTYEELIYNWKRKDIDRLCENIGVLVDGPYIDELNDNKVMLRGSNNQKIIIFNDRLINIYNEYMTKNRKIQNVLMGEKIISVGIHNRKEE